MDEAAVEVVIEPKKGWKPVNLRELWKFRELLYFLAWRDVKVKYKQTALGVVWALLQPLLTMVIFSVLFGRLARMPSDGAPYPIFVFIGLLPWNYFSSVLGQSTNSLVAGSNLVSKIYFPQPNQMPFINCNSSDRYPHRTLDGYTQYGIPFKILSQRVNYQPYY